MNKKKKVLIFPAGAENAMEIYHSIRYNVNFEVYGLSGKSDHAKFLYPEDRYFEGDFYVSNSNFVEKFNEFLDDNNIDVIIPTHDTVALYLAKYREKLKANVICSNYETALVAREKKRTYQIFSDDWFCPMVFDVEDDKIKFPVFSKPNIGEGAKGARMINSKSELDELVKNQEKVVITEYLPGDEYTIDCFTNRNGELLFVGPRTRERVQMGISFRSNMIELSEEIEEIAKVINKKLSFRGPWFFQLKKDINDKLKLLEVSTRQAGTMALYRQIGVNFALLGIFDSLGFDVNIIKNDFKVTLDRCLFNRYKIDYDYENVYVDFDDTLIINNKVNEKMISFLYQCLNDNKKVYLITKHEDCLSETLEKYCINPMMFDDIIHINIGDVKSKYIEKLKSIFIDNYYFERKEVFDSIGIPVFDVDAIDVLMKY